MNTLDENTIDFLSRRIAEMPEHSTGHILGYRGWQWITCNDGGFMLISAYDNKPWFPRVPAIAFCCHCKVEIMNEVCSIVDAKEGVNRTVSTRRAPALFEYCKCGRSGIYARKSVDDFKAYMITGVVALWGRVYEHCEGYRAEVAYPVAFEYQVKGNPFIPFTDNFVLEQLSTNYGVPIWTSDQCAEYIRSNQRRYHYDVEDTIKQIQDDVNRSMYLPKFLLNGLLRNDIS